MIEALLIVSLSLNVLLIVGNFAFSVYFARQLRGEAERTTILIEKTIVAMQARHASEAADALSVLETNKEAVRQHKRTFDIEQKAYEKAVDEKRKKPVTPMQDKVIVKDLETGHDIEIQA